MPPANAPPAGCGCDIAATGKDYVGGAMQKLGTRYRPEITDKNQRAICKPDCVTMP
jgi:hypothetical protein